jgi:hypothetical protein
MRSRPVVLAAALVFSSVAALAAQECVGLPKGQGVLAVGPTGTDGASGTGLAFGYQGASRSVQLAYQSLGVFAYANPQKTRSAQANFKLKGLRGCITAGVKWQAWDTERADWSGWSDDDPTVIVERHTIGGNYDRLRFPVGVSFGRTMSLKRLSLVPYANPFVVFELEDFQSNMPNDDAPSQSRSSVGGGLELGMAMRAGWFVARPMISVTNTRDRALSGKRNFADIALHFGVVF